MMSESLAKIIQEIKEIENSDRKARLMMEWADETVQSVVREADLNGAIAARRELLRAIVKLQYNGLV
jgi:hypothetical protein